MNSIIALYSIILCIEYGVRVYLARTSITRHTITLKSPNIQTRIPAVTYNTSQPGSVGFPRPEAARV